MIKLTLTKLLEKVAFVMLRYERNKRRARFRAYLKCCLEESEKEIKFLYKNLDKKIIIEKKYSEKEINEILKECCISQDHVSFRRELIENGYLSRTNDCREYWRS